MKRNKIIEELYETGLVRELINNCDKGRTQSFNLDDLEQDVYMILLEQPEKKIEDIYEKKQLKFFITRIILNQLNSSLSPFYYKYRKFSFQTYDLDEYIDEYDRHNEDNDYD